MLLISSLLLLTSCVLIAQGDHWGYPAENPNGVVNGEENWGGTCSMGRKQSPIDLTQDASVTGRYPPLYFKHYDKLLENATIRNTGHSLQIDIPKDEEYLLTGGGLPGVYVMDQMHFHWASEHTIEGKRFGLELHIVSHEQRFKNFTTAVQNKKGVAVLGILFHVSDEINPILKNILDSAESVKDAVGTSNEVKKPFSPVQLLPKQRSSYFRYEGSLTTPSCDEAVIWTILDKSVPFAIHQIERFQQLKDAEGAQLTHNFRQLQRLNSRPLVYVRDVYDVDRSAFASASPLMVTSAILSAISIGLHMLHAFY